MLKYTLKYGFAPVEQYQSHSQGAYTHVYAMAAAIYCCLTATVPVQPTERLLGVNPPNSSGPAPWAWPWPGFWQRLLAMLRGR